MMFREFAMVDSHELRHRMEMCNEGFTSGGWNSIEFINLWFGEKKYFFKKRKNIDNASCGKGVKFGGVSKHERAKGLSEFPKVMIRDFLEDSVFFFNPTTPLSSDSGSNFYNVNPRYERLPSTFLLRFQIIILDVVGTSSRFKLEIIYTKKTHWLYVVYNFPIVLM